jgi:gas vesicle protein
MPDQSKQSYERARDLAEGAVEAYARGNQAKGQELAEQAVKTDRGAVEDVVRELEQDTRPSDAAK